MHAVGSLYRQRTQTEFILRRLRREAPDGMQIQKLRTAVSLACFNDFLEKMKHTTGTFDVVSLPTLRMNAGALGTYVRALLMPKIMSKSQI